MRPFLPLLFAALGLGLLPACTVNYYVPAGTDAAAVASAPRPHRSRPPRYQSPPQSSAGWESAPVASTTPVRTTPPVQTAPPVRTSPPVATTPPVRNSPPVRPTAPVQTSPPVATTRPVRTNPVTTQPGTSSPVATTRPVRTVPTPTVPGPEQPATGGTTSVPITGQPVAGSASGQLAVLPEQPATPVVGPGKTLAVLPEQPLAPTGNDKPIRPSTPLVSSPVVLADEAPVAEPQGEPSVVFTKTPCFGTCPHYTATIYPDGRVSYEGFRYAPIQGKREFRLSVSTVNTILAQAREINFADLKEHYTDGATDLPATTATIRQASGSVKMVRVESGAPVELTNLFRYIEKQITDGLGVTADQ